MVNLQAFLAKSRGRDEAAPTDIPPACAGSTKLLRFSGGCCGEYDRR
jgi:hypothetical protein